MNNGTKNSEDAPIPFDPNHLLTVQEVADYLRVSRVTVWRWCKHGVIPAFRIGRTWRINRADLPGFIKTRQQ